MLGAKTGETKPQSQATGSPSRHRARCWVYFRPAYGLFAGPQAHLHTSQDSSGLPGFPSDGGPSESAYRQVAECIIIFIMVLIIYFVFPVLNSNW